MNEIKQQLIAKIGDTSEREIRVQQQVNLKKIQQPKETKREWVYYSTIVAFIGVLSLLIYLIPSALNEGEGTQTANEQPQVAIPLDEDDEETVSTPDEEKGTVNDSEVEEKTPSQFEAKVETNYRAENHSGWKTSPDGSQQATINGKLEHASEEGEAVLVIENIKTKEATIYQLRDNDLSQYTPKVVEWIDDHRVFVIIGPSYGMVTRGGKLYELNLKDNVVTPVIEELTLREEIMSLKVNADGTFTYQKHVYNNDDYNYDETHIEEGTLPIPVAK